MFIRFDASEPSLVGWGQLVVAGERLIGSCGVYCADAFCEVF